jgi:hypothetical protein
VLKVLQHSEMTSALLVATCLLCAQHPSFVLLLSSKAGGVGLNIIGANRLVLFDPGKHTVTDKAALGPFWAHQLAIHAYQGCECKSLAAAHDMQLEGAH